jgi:hypothetical protein
MKVACEAQQCPWQIFVSLGLASTYFLDMSGGAPSEPMAFRRVPCAVCLFTVWYIRTISPTYRTVDVHNFHYAKSLILNAYFVIKKSIGNMESLRNS